jgi:hypothetical protein
MTSSALISIARLRRVVAALEDRRAPEAADGEWLVECLSQYLDAAPRGASFDMCFGLAVMPGEVSWWTIEAIEARDVALCDLAQHFFPNLTVAGKAREIERQGRRYATSTWRLDRDRREMPKHYAGTAKAWLWLAFKSGATMPLKQRQLEAILTAQERPDVA